MTSNLTVSNLNAIKNIIKAAREMVELKTFPVRIANCFCDAGESVCEARMFLMDSVTNNDKEAHEFYLVAIANAKVDLTAVKEFIVADQEMIEAPLAQLLVAQANYILSLLDK